ncbi:uncharacterized protein LOC118433901 [Folsomia candida]|uniref:uncharacterized protein LOC118433901 n=1 Tax=Folsomia candida TaxID=158441 RepID=UPI001604D2E0|nr:uncharacterized protein LOC118433901 [Folsomia candida]
MELDRSRSPCLFGITLQQGAQLVAGVNIVLGIWFFVIFSLYCFTVGSDIDEVAGGKVTGMIIAYWIIIGVLVFLSVLINIILLKGAYQKSQEKVKIFLMGLIVLVVVGFIVTLVRHFSLTAFLLEFLFTFLSDLPLAYEWWVVYSFFKEIRANDEIAKADQAVCGRDYLSPSGHWYCG